MICTVNILSKNKNKRKHFITRYEPQQHWQPIFASSDQRMPTLQPISQPQSSHSSLQIANLKSEMQKFTNFNTAKLPKRQILNTISPTMPIKAHNFIHKTNKISKNSPTLIHQTPQIANSQHNLHRITNNATQSTQFDPQKQQKTPPNLAHNN